MENHHLMDEKGGEPPVTTPTLTDGLPGRRFSRGARLVWTLLAIILVIEILAMVWLSRRYRQSATPMASPTQGAVVPLPEK
jgi:hypothetical protein